MKEKIGQKLYIVVNADNINADISVSRPFFDHSAASAFLQEQYIELSKGVFAGEEVKEVDQANCTENTYTLYSLKSNDFHYGQVKEIVVPAKNVASELAFSNLKAPDADSRCRILSKKIKDSLYQKSIDIDLTGKEVLEAIMTNDMNALLSSLTGYTATELLQAAHLCRTKEFHYHGICCDYAVGRVIGHHRDGITRPFNAEVSVDMRSNCVSCIRMGDKKVQGAELTQLLDSLMDPKIYLLKGRDPFLLFREDCIPTGMEKVAYWYKKEATDHDGT